MAPVRPWPQAALLVLVVLAGALVPAPAAQDGWRLMAADRNSSVSLRRGTPHFALAADETLHPELGLDFHVEMRARVVLPEAGRWRLGVEVHGAQVGLRHGLAPMEMFELKALTEEAPARRMTDWLVVDEGPLEVDLQLVFKTTRRGDRRLTVLWERAFDEDGGFPVEPLPWWAVVPAATGAEPAAGDLARAGRSLLATKGCTSCHAPSAAMAQAVERRASLSLDGVGDRLGAAWLTRWLADPAALRPSTDMPDVVSDGPARDALAVLLSNLGEAPEPHHMGRGADLYHTRGCVGCHEVYLTQAERGGDRFADTSLPALPPSAPFGDLSGKWRAPALRDALEDPASLHPGWVAGALVFDSSEAYDLADFLLGVWRDPRRRAAPDQLARGAEVWNTSGCGACHSAAELPTAAPPAPALDALRAGHGCLDPADEGTPRYALSDAERAQLAAGLASARLATGVPAPLDLAARRLDELGCLSCHSRDGRGGLEAGRAMPFTTLGERADLGDEGRLPPDLSGVGAKLNRDALAGVLLDGHRQRPWMAAAMPRFRPALVEPLVDGLARLDGVHPGDDASWPRGDDALVLAGRQIVGSAGLSCISCHAVGDLAPPGTAGLDLLHMAPRLRYEWFARYMHAPARFKPGTRMPAYGAGDRSVLDSVLGGDLSAQIDALWAWMALGDDAPLPEGVDRGEGQRVAVGERPVVLRTFLEEAGARGIAVGFPVGLHLGYDADRPGLAAVWAGEFLDASGAWAGRGGNVSGGRGELLWSAAAGPALGLAPARWGGESTPARFAGYRLDRDGVPTFLAQLGAAEVAERIEPRRLPVPTWVRTVQVRGLLPGQAFWLLDDPQQRVLTVEGGEATPSELEGRRVQLVQALEGNDTVTLILELVP